MTFWDWADKHEMILMGLTFFGIMTLDNVTISVVNAWNNRGK